MVKPVSPITRSSKTLHFILHTLRFKNHPGSSCIFCRPGFCFYFQYMSQQPRYIIFLLLFFCCAKGLQAQPALYNFHYITTTEGLNDGSVSSIVRDKYGYTWLATLGALNRYNGKTVERFAYRQGDSSAAPNGIPYSMESDLDGRLWTGYDFGLFEYDFNKNRFREDTAFSGVYVQKMQAATGHRLYLLTSKGFFCYNTKTGAVTNMQQQDSILGNHPNLSLFLQGEQLYIGSVNGYKIYNTRTKQTLFIPLHDDSRIAASTIFADSKGNVWGCDLSRLVIFFYQPATGRMEIFSNRAAFKTGTIQFGACNFVSGNANDIWISTTIKGLFHYDLATDRLEPVAVKNGFQYQRCIYKSADGNIWVGAANGGFYFDTKPNPFSTIYPLPDGIANPFGRAMLEDSRGNWWFTTGNGISRYQPAVQQYTVWKNEAGKPDKLYYNSVRGINEDDNGVIWIATGRGINSYTPGDNQLHFYTIKDSIPQAFYYCANRDSKGRIWFGTKDYDGLYYYVPSETKFHSIKEHPLLKDYRGLGTRIVYEDSRHRLWIGLNGGGLIMMDEAAGTIKRWYNDGSTRNTIIGNLIVDIKEDKKGLIWVSTFNGVTGIDLANNQYTWLDDRNFFRTNYTGPLAVDAKNRLWIGTATGLYVADEQRKSAGYFDESSGLSGVSFTEHSGYFTKDGYCMMPTTQGMIRFNPLEYDPKENEYGFYIAWIDLVNKRKTVPRLDAASLELGYAENFFSIGLEALNYSNPAQTWYAYKLDGLENDWHYTQDPKAVYTSVPGGDYVFRYKASSDPAKWNVQEKQLHIHIAKVFYKTAWFWLVVIAMLLALLYWLYRYRLWQQQRVFTLENKAQLLEKEKALVMYENLKQHLNPHFLFNSLTSLSSLIRLDQAMAGNFLDKMSTVYRYILKNRDNEVVTLGEEIKFVQLYIDLQKTRFEKGLVVDMQIDEEFHHRKVAPVTLQNLVENAIKHNTADDESPLVIQLFIKDDYLFVRNNLQKKKFVETSNRQGLANMESLYHYLSARPMEIIEDEQYFTVKIPLL